MSPARAAKDEDDWSESDDENLSEVETSVWLGLPDGPIDPSNVSDIHDAAVSRIGGYPVFLSSSEPSIEASQCKACSFPMELLVQMWCPFEESVYDRALYVWGCARGGCQYKDGSVRAWRGLRLNEKYAAKLKQRMARKRERELAEAKAKEEAGKAKGKGKTNPFTIQNASPGLFGIGSQAFGLAVPSPTTPPAGAPKDPAEDDLSDSDESASSDESALVRAMASTKLDSTAWAAAPAYPPIYLSTSSEYLPPPPKTKSTTAGSFDPDIEPGADKKSDGFFSEAYENSMDLDHVFERFSKRVGYEGAQCVRYELGGTPLPFASDAVFDRLFPRPHNPQPVPVTKAAFKVTLAAQKRVYAPTDIPTCPACGGPRVFECQLMPNLINVLRAPGQGDEGAKRKTAEERRKEVEAALKKGGRGMEWGTCMVFSCERDCSGKDGEAKEVWREEYVLVQWDE